MLRREILALLLVSAAALAGCNPAQPPPPPMKAPDVVVSRAIVDQVTDFEEFQGKTEAVETVEVRARVSGYLDKLHFEEGADLHKGDLLFTIDQRPLKAELDRMDANLGLAEAHQKRLEADHERARALLPKGSISREEYDKIAGDLSEAQSATKSARAARSVAQLNFDYSRVTCPINGRISRRMIDCGNMVKADETALTYIANLDPMYVYFDVDERTYLRIYRPLVEKETTLAQVKEMTVSMGLADEKGYPHTGKINFVDNHIDQNTGSVWVRGLFANPKKLFAPGLFVRVRLPVGEPHKAVLIPEQALATDQGQKFVWVVDDEGHAVYRRIQLGAQHGALREVEKGVDVGERVIVSGLQRVRNDPKKGYAEVTVVREEPTQQQ
jgi:RND family efflux transporter MFP subunit